MKKYLLIILFIAVSFAGIAQVTTYQDQTIKEYKITTTGSSNGLTIPNPFYIQSPTAVIYPVKDSTKQYSEYQLYTYIIDTVGAKWISNDAIQSNVYTTYIDSVYVQNDSTLKSWVGNYTKAFLEGIYGAENVTEIK